MKIKDLTDAPDWLREAKVSNEEVSVVDGKVIWHSGVWHGGEWRDGVWHDGIWLGGTWHDGLWRGGGWYDGHWYNGHWHGGGWCNGTWYGGEWRDGVWIDGIWRGGRWHDGIWRGGVWQGGIWQGGIWRSGVWLGGVWHNGTWYRGDWQDKTNNRLLFMASAIGITFGEDGFATAYRSTQENGKGRHNSKFTQPEGEYREENLPQSGLGTCVKGIHVTTQAQALIYFGVSPTAQLWEVKFKREDLLDCDGQKARIKGGIFRKIDWPFYEPKTSKVKNENF